MVDQRKIETLADLQEIVRTGGAEKWTQWGYVTAQDLGWGYLFNYTPKASERRFWTPFEEMSRGLILSKDGEVIARPFCKFFNWGETVQGIPRKTESPIQYVLEKMDGSMGTIFKNPQTEEWQVATRGSINSREAKAGNELLQKYNLEAIPETHTLVVEIISKRIIVDYKGRKELVLLGARNRTTGEYASLFELKAIAGAVEMPIATTYDFETPDDIIAVLEDLSVNEEGFVSVHEDGSRFKFKGKRYLEMMKTLSGLSYTKIAGWYMNGVVEEMMLKVPEEWRDEVDNYRETFVKKTEARRETLVGYHDKCKAESKVDADPKETIKNFVQNLKGYGLSGFDFGLVMQLYRGNCIQNALFKEEYLAAKGTRKSETVVFTKKWEK